MAGRSYSSVREFASAIPNHLLLGSLLEHLCFVYESNPARSRMLFKGTGTFRGASTVNVNLVFTSIVYNTLTFARLFCLSKSYWTAISSHEPPFAFGNKWWVQHRQTAAQPSLYWAASCGQLLSPSTGGLHWTRFFFVVALRTWQLEIELSPLYCFLLNLVSHNSSQGQQQLSTNAHNPVRWV